MPNAIYIAEIRIALTIEEKIKTKHNVTPHEVREAFVLRPEVRAAWENNQAHGRRVIAFGKTYQGRPIIAALYPIDVRDGIWMLMTARSPKD